MGFFKPKGIRDLDKRIKARKKSEKFKAKRLALSEKEENLQQALRIETLKTKIKKTKSKRGPSIFGSIKSFNSPVASSQRGLVLGESRSVKKKRSRKVGFDDEDFDILGGLI